MLTHLYTTYAIITPEELIENDACLNTSYDVNQPIETLFEKIEVAIKYADASHNVGKLQDLLCHCPKRMAQVASHHIR